MSLDFLVYFKSWQLWRDGGDVEQRLADLDFDPVSGLADYFAPGCSGQVGRPARMRVLQSVAIGHEHVDIDAYPVFPARGQRGAAPEQEAP